MTDAILLTKAVTSVRKTLSDVQVDQEQCEILDKEFKLLLKSLEYGLYLSNHTLWVILDSDPKISGAKSLIYIHGEAIKTSDDLLAELNELKVCLEGLDRSLFPRYFAGQLKVIKTSRFVLELKSKEL